jgi:hypothetical protein
VRKHPSGDLFSSPLTFSVIPTFLVSNPAWARRGEQVAGSEAPPQMHAVLATPSAKRQSTAKSYEPFPFANMAPNSPSFSPLIPSEK